MLDRPCGLENAGDRVRQARQEPQPTLSGLGGAPGMQECRGRVFLVSARRIVLR
jgi:hypothetical protein